MKTERTDNTKNNHADGSTEQIQQSSRESHGDLENTSPTDSRADEKVIVNHRDLPVSFKNHSNSSKQE